MKFENTEVWGFKHAIRGMRNPMNSWEKSDSGICLNAACDNCSAEKNCGKVDTKDFVLGKNDLALMQGLIMAGSPHRKFMRQLFVSVDITAPLYWWKEFDTYKVGTVSNSCSTMHKLASTPITLNCFEMDDYCGFFESHWKNLIGLLEQCRKEYNETKDKRYWKELIRLLPESWLQKRTITMSYENVLNMLQHRKNHKLTEWGVKFIEWAHTLPYADVLLFIDEV